VRSKDKQRTSTVKRTEVSKWLKQHSSTIRIVWVKRHSGNTENEAVNELARAGAEGESSSDQLDLTRPK